jgi:hypothetical protein
MKKLMRDDTEHGKEYYLASEVDKALAQPAQELLVFCMHWEDRWGCNHYVDPKEPHPINAEPLYTTSPAAQPAPVPLNGSQIRVLWEQETKPERGTMAFVIGFVRAIEAHHGITEKVQP